MKTHRDVVLVTMLAILLTAVTAVSWVLLVRYPSDGVRLNTDVDVRERDQRTAIVVQPGSPAATAGLRTGDTVFRIDGIDVFETARLRAHFLAPVSGRMVTHYIIYTPKGPARIAVQRRPAGEFVPWRSSLLVNLLIAIPYLLVGMFTHWKRPGDPAARLLNVLCVVLALFSIAPKELLIAIAEPAEFLLPWLLLLLPLVPALLLHFSLAFPDEHPFLSRHRLIAPLLYVLPGAAFLMTFRRPGGENRGDVLLIGGFLVYLIAAILVFFARYRSSASEEKRQMLWPLWGLSICVAVTLLNVAMKSTFLAPPGHRYIEVGVHPLWFVILPITIAIAILKYRLFDIDIVIRRTITYTLVMAIVLGLNFGAIGVLGRVLATTGGASQNASILSTLFVAALFAPIRNGVQRRVNRHFSRGRLSEPDALRQMHQAIDAATDLQSLYEEAASRLQQIFHSRTVVVFSFDSSADQMARVTATVGISEELAAALSLRADSSATRSVLNLDRSGSLPSDRDSAAIMPSRARLVAPVRVRDELLAVITLGARISDERYDEADERLVASIAAQLALAIENRRLRERSATDSEWHALDRLARLVFIAASRLEGMTVANVPELVERIGESIAAAGASLPDSNLGAAVDRLMRCDALALDRGSLCILKRGWRTVSDCSRPLNELASELRNRIGAYEIVERIGGGGMGEVFRGINVHDGSVAALKLLPAGAGNSNDSRRRLEREGAIVSTLAHPNIVRVLERGEHDGQLYIAMELVEGETLASRMRAPSWRPSDAVDVAMQIASALAALHTAGVVHRDIKPSNIMITATGRAVLLDFGLARDAASRTITGSSHIIGSLPYMSPEQFEGARVDARSDVWSFSVVLYEMLARRRPWAASDPARLAVEIASSHPDCSPLQHLANAPLLAVVREGLEPALDLRIRDGIELHRRLLHAEAHGADIALESEASDAPTQPMAS